MTIGHDPDRPLSESHSEWEWDPLPRTSPFSHPVSTPEPIPKPGTSVSKLRAAASLTRFAWVGVLVLVLVLGLGIGLGHQNRKLDQLSGHIDEISEQLAQRQAYDGERLDALEERAGSMEERTGTLEGRAGELEQVVGDVFNSEAIAAAVLPSVFKVQAGSFSGTAFAVGSRVATDGTNLLTNYHVVEQVWQLEEPTVVLERTNQEYEATIVEVDEDADLALLRTDDTFVGLVVTQDEVRSGQPIVAVGAPLGLTDTVTTGVVSTARRELPGASTPWIQFDASIQPGNSGGPVINASKEVVGIATAKAGGVEGIGLAIPVEVACNRFGVC